MDARHRDVLVAVIREYVDSTEPVGSRILARRHFPNLSAATLRNVMADLEEMGYLVRPPASAGRVRRAKAYRFYVESFPPAPGPKGAVPGESLPTRRSGIDGFMERTSSHLSSATKLTGLLLAPPLKQTTLARVDLIPLEDDRALAVLVTDAGWVTARAVTLDPPLGIEEVRAIGRELNRRYSGRTVQDVVDMETEPSDPLDALHTRRRRAAAAAVSRGYFDRQRDGSPRHRRSFPRPPRPLPALLALEAAGGRVRGRQGLPGSDGRHRCASGLTSSRDQRCLHRSREALPAPDPPARRDRSRALL